MNNLRIINKSGISNDSKLFLNDIPLDHCTKVEIDPITNGNFVKATVTLEVVETDITTSDFAIKIINAHNLETVTILSRPVLQGWHNVTEWTDSIPISFLPFYVWCTAKDADSSFTKDQFERLYETFITKTGAKDTEEIKQWCSDQYTHYYECNH